MSYTTIKNVKSLGVYIEEIKDLRDYANQSATVLGVESFATALMALVPGLGILFGAASFSTAAAGLYVANVASTLGSFIDQLEDIEDAIQNSGGTIDAVKLEISMGYDSFMQAKYPEKINVIGFHAKNSGGWILL